MSEHIKRGLSEILSAAAICELDEWIAKYPKDQKKSAVMQALMLLQQEQGFLKAEDMDAVALYLDMPEISVYEVASFYSMYKQSPTGRHVINVCSGISCHLNGSSAIVRYLEDKLQIKSGETTPDGRFTIRKVECLAACVNAPMMQVGQQYHENLTSATVDAILDNYV